MTFCRIPAQLTEEEKFLQQKYLKLKKKKKLLQQQKAPPKPEQTPVSTIQNQLKRGIDGQPKHGLDPKELAKKLIKSGAISAIVKPPEKEKQGFKRSTNSQRKKLEQQSDKPKYQPFSAASYKPSITSDLENDNSIGQRSSSIFDSNNLPTKEKEAIAREETFREKRRDGKAHYVNRDIPNVGTIYVHGIGVNEQLLKTAFAQFGNIIKVNCEFNKNCGFVTFESIDQANRAIDSMNGTQVQNITLKVSLARKQAFVNKSSLNQSSSLDSNNESTTENQTTTSSTPHPQQSNVFNNDWTSIASTYEQKIKPAKDKRSLVSYEDIY